MSGRTVTEDVKTSQNAPKHAVQSCGYSVKHASKCTKDTDMSWNHLHASQFNTRIGPDYAEHRRKAPSAEAIYTCIGCDLVTRSTKAIHIAQKLDFSDVPGSDEKLYLPNYIVINNQMPSYAPENPIWGDRKEDGEGFSLIFYLALSEQSKETCRKHPPAQLPASFRLLRKFLDADKTTSPLVERLKGIVSLANPEEIDLAGPIKAIVTKYNAKPFLIRSTSTFYTGANYVEVDIDVHGFGYAARRGLHGMKEFMSQGSFDYAYVIEGKPDDELPEQILGCCRISNLDLEINTPLHDVLYVKRVVADTITEEATTTETTATTPEQGEEQ